MKNIPFKALLCLLTLFISCEKPENLPEETTYLMKVKEYKTNIPLPDVKITFYKCSKYDLVFGCQSTSVWATGSTDQNGEYAFTQFEFNQSDEGIGLSKPQYFGTTGGEGERFMQPEAWVKLALKATNTYPDTSRMDITVMSDLNNGSSLTFWAPQDSLVNFRLIGNEINQVKWVVYTMHLPCFYYCPRDTLAFGSLILNPKKFETLTSSIEY